MNKLIKIIMTILAIVMAIMPVKTYKADTETVIYDVQVGATSFVIDYQGSIHILANMQNLKAGSSYELFMRISDASVSPAAYEVVGIIGDFRGNVWYSNDYVSNSDMSRTGYQWFSWHFMDLAESDSGSYWIGITTRNVSGVGIGSSLVRFLLTSSAVAQKYPEAVTAYISYSNYLAGKYYYEQSNLVMMIIETTPDPPEPPDPPGG